MFNPIIDHRVSKRKLNFWLKPPNYIHIQFRTFSDTREKICFLVKGVQGMYKMIVGIRNTGFLNIRVVENVRR